MAFLRRLISNRLLSHTSSLWCRNSALLNRKLTVGDKASLTKIFTEEDVLKFAELTGDFNPLHFDEEFSADSQFGRPIVHGVLNLGLISAVVGTELPGPGSVVTSLNIKFTAPVYIDEEIEAEVEATKISARKAELSVFCRKTSDREVAIMGNIKVLLPRDLHEDDI